MIEILNINSVYLSYLSKSIWEVFLNFKSYCLKIQHLFGYDQFRKLFNYLKILIFLHFFKLLFHWWSKFKIKFLECLILISFQVYSCYTLLHIFWKGYVFIMVQLHNLCMCICAINSTWSKILAGHFY